MEPSAPRAAVYARRSRNDDDHESDSVGTQKADAQALIESNGWQSVGVFADEGISASTGKARPAWSKLWESIEAGDIDIVVARHHDRLWRSLQERADLFGRIDRERIPLQFCFTHAPDIDLSTAGGHLVAGVMGSAAEYEAKLLSERVRRAKDEARSKGEYTGGPRAFGWTTGRQSLDPEEAPVVAELFDRIIAGDGISTITKWLNAEGWKTARGGTWSRHSVRQLLQNPKTAGYVRQPDGSLIEATWPGAVDLTTWEQVNAVLADPSRKTTHRLRDYLLTGIIIDHHGRPMRGKTRQRQDGPKRLYRTPSGADEGPTQDGVQIGADDVEAMVVEAVLRLTDDLTLPEPVVDDASVEVARLEAEAKDLADMYGRGDLTASAWQAANAGLMARLKEARTQIRTTPSVADTDWSEPGLLRKRWDSLTLHQQRAAIALFVDQAVVGPGRTTNETDLTRVTIIRRS